jgi:DNA helicase-2/ATP-dependent DNA helicase PcrA
MTGVDIIGLLDKMKANGLYLSALDLQGNSKGVNLTTIHGAKGAEYDTVIMFGCTRNEWEASRSPATSYKLPDTLLYNTPEDKIETGRKIFYVAATRARRELIITYANKTTDGKSLEPTQFIAESKLPTTIITDVNIDKYLELQFCKKQIAFDLDKILIKERLSEFQMSASAFIKYLRCPITFYMENVLRVPSIPHPALLYGNAIHLALSKLFNAARGNVEMTLLLVIQIFDDYMQKRKHQISKIDYNLRIKLGHDALTHYYNEVYREANKITLNEYTIKNVLINGVPSKGIVDKMEFHGNGVNIVDYKTGSIISAKAKIKGPSEKVPNGGDYWIQGIFNELLMDNNTTKVWKFESFALGMVEADNYTVLPMIASREEKFMISRLVKEVYDKIMDTQFFDGCDDPDCYYCNLLKK